MYIYAYISICRVNSSEVGVLEIPLTINQSINILKSHTRTQEKPHPSTTTRVGCYAPSPRHR